MPILDWIGKDKVVNHHLEVPYRVLDRKYSFDSYGQHEEDNNSENMIIHGDNLEALKSLLPQYENKIKCIYIDPPYNTGNEGWVYNDNVNDPRIKAWLGKTVGAESEDLSRHDKWLCMVYPRLRLLHRLMSEDGVIFISIDDNEQANLKLVCDEIFGKTNFVACIPWRKRTAKSDVPFGISQDCEYILCYAKSSNFKGGLIGKERKYYESDDFPERPWRFHDLTTQRTIYERPNSNYTMVNPKTKEEFPVNPLRSWAVTNETFKKYYDENRIIFPGDYDFLNITKPVLRYWKDDDIKKAGTDFGIVAASTFLPSEVGMTQDGTKEITDIFGNKAFNFPKPSSLIQFLINIATITDKSTIILDSFAGSGTTAHAVLNMNKADGGNRKFILIEMMDYADSITAERVKRVISGYGEEKKVVAGIDGDFSYYELGDTLMNGDLLNENISTDKIREYIYFTETRLHIPKTKIDEEYLLGCHANNAYYFYYEKNKVTTLNRDFLHTVKTKADGYVIYADLCTLSDSELEKYHITFKKIPRDITKF